MNKMLIFFALLIIFNCCTLSSNKKVEAVKGNMCLVNYVDPYIGSDLHGHVFVGASVPFGAVQLGPCNIYKGWDWCSGYHYSDSIMVGFAHTHLSGTGCTDLGDILIMPTTGELQVKPGTQVNYRSGYASLYSHKAEIVEPGYYAVTLERYQVRAELTATERVGIHKYTFLSASDANIIIDLKQGLEDKAIRTYLKKLDNNTIIGYRVSDGWSNDQRVFFAIETSSPFTDFTIYNDSIKLTGKTATNESLKGILTFKDLAKNDTILLKVGISPVSVENAMQNIEKEVPAWNFRAIRTQAISSWSQQLNRLRIEADPVTMRVFNTALFHTMIAPTLYNDCNGDYLGADKKVYRNENFNNYTTFSLWDSYRAANPLFTLTQRDRVPHFINSMLELYKQEGKLPEWHLMGFDNRVMIGYNAVPVIVDAYFKGIQGFDVNTAYEAVVKTAMRDDRGVQYVKSKGYMPCDLETESVAKAMEYSVYDWGIAQMAKDLGKTDDYEYFTKRSKYYKNYFDPKDGFFKGKKQDGSFRTGFNPVSSSHRDDEFCEGNAWQYLWLVPHDVPGLIELLGGKDKFVAKLDQLFQLNQQLGKGASADISGLIGMYAHGNEPCHHITYLYAFAGEQWKTAEKVRQIMRELYTDKPDGLCGNEDCGQMSAWYIWSAMGFYPVNPQNGVYVFGSPAVKEAHISLPDNKSFTVVAHDNSLDNIYIQSVLLNGKKYTKSYIRHQDILKGGKLEFFMGSKPNKNFGKDMADMPG